MTKIWYANYFLDSTSVNQNYMLSIIFYHLYFPLCLWVIQRVFRRPVKIFTRCFTSARHHVSNAIAAVCCRTRWRVHDERRAVYLASRKNSCKQAASDRCFHRFLRHASAHEILIFTVRIDKLFLPLFRLFSRVKRKYIALHSYNVT